MKRWISITLFIALATALSVTAYSFNIDGRRWAGNSAVIYTGVAGTAASGVPWSQALEEAAQMWREQTGFNLITRPEYRDPCGGYEGGFPLGEEDGAAPGDRTNGVGFTDTICGASYGRSVLAVTLLYTEDSPLGEEITEAEIVFNKAVSYDIYDGPYNGKDIDFRRVAIHELGHVMGLNHEAREPSIMRSSIGNLFTLQPDDIAAVDNLYGGYRNCPVSLLDFGIRGDALTRGDCSVRQFNGARDDSYLDVYQLELRHPARVTINMASSSLDSVLLLLDADSHYLELDDDSGSGCDALITRELEAGTYAILANTYQAPSACGDNEGPYRLQVGYESTQMPRLGRSVSLQGHVAAAGFQGGVTTDGGTSWRNVISAEQRFDAIGRIDIDPLHVNQPGFIVTAVVMEDGQLLIKHPQTGFIPYDPATAPSQLGTAKTLAAAETVDILRGVTGAELGFSRIAVGFMVGYGLLSNPQELYFHAEPISLVINP